MEIIRPSKDEKFTNVTYYGGGVFHCDDATFNSPAKFLWISVYHLQDKKSFLVMCSKSESSSDILDQCVKMSNIYTSVAFGSYRHAEALIIGGIELFELQRCLKHVMPANTIFRWIYCDEI